MSNPNNFSDALQPLYNGPPPVHENGGKGSTRTSSNAALQAAKNVVLKPNNANSGPVQAPVCLSSSQREILTIHRMNDYSDCLADDKKILPKAYFVKNFKIGPSR